MRHIRETKRRMALLADSPENEMDLARACLVVARSEYPDLEESTYIGRLDDMASRLAARVSRASNLERAVDELNYYVFSEEGFRGNSENYYDPKNSFLNEVIERKLGIPITLSIVYMEVGKRVGMPVYGIGLPGHFIVGILCDAKRIYVDPFGKGRILMEDDCRELAQTYLGERGLFDPRFLDPVSPKQILIRLMRNLKTIYAQSQSQEKSWQMIEWILTLDPDSIPELRERGLLLEAVGDPSGAVADFERLVRLWPDSDEAEALKARIEKLRREKTVLH